MNTKDPHPNYGPCDGFGPNGSCSECVGMVEGGMLTPKTKALVARARELAGYKYQSHTIHVPEVLNALANLVERLTYELRV